MDSAPGRIASGRGADNRETARDVGSMLPDMRRMPISALGVLLGTLLLTACSGVPVAPAYTQEELEARCLRTGG